MPKNNSIEKVLVIGSGPTVIGQAAEFDYIGVKACKVLKENGIEVVVINSNPASIMTDSNFADKVYIEALNIKKLEEIILIEKPDCILPYVGGKIAMELTMQLEKSGFLERNDIRILGSSLENNEKTENKIKFKKLLDEVNLPSVQFGIFADIDEGIAFSDKIGYPILISSYNGIKGEKGEVVFTKTEFEIKAKKAIKLSKTNEMLIEKALIGWKEIEFQFIRDLNENVVMISSMENIDSLGIHSGDSVVVSPVQTLANKEFKILKSASIKLIEKLNVVGPFKIKFAVNPNNLEYVILETNLKYNRETAISSKITGYSMVKVGIETSLGYHLNEIKSEINSNLLAAFEPKMDYVALKIPKWSLNRFAMQNKELNTKMQSTGETLAIDVTLESAFMKAIRSLEENLESFVLEYLKESTREDVYKKLRNVDTQRIFVITEALRRGFPVEEISKITMIDKFFIGILNKIVKMEQELAIKSLEPELLLKAKRFGFTDKVISKINCKSVHEVYEMRKRYNIFANFKKIDSFSGEYEPELLYYYSSYEDENEANEINEDLLEEDLAVNVSNNINENKEEINKKVVVVGPGPIKIGQGNEFDYACVHAILALKKLGYEAILISNSPETLATDLELANKIYFEPITIEDIENVVNVENPLGVILEFGGETAIKLAKELEERKINILGTLAKDINRVEDRQEFDNLLTKCQILRPIGETVFTLEDALNAAKRLEYPVLIKPSYNIGGEGIEIALDRIDLEFYMNKINQIAQNRPVLIEKVLNGKEIEVVAISDGEKVLVPGIMELLEKPGIHSGDSITVYPPQNIEKNVVDDLLKFTEKIAQELSAKGIINLKFILNQGLLYLIEVNTYASRTVPFLTKATNLPISDIVVEVLVGKKLSSLQYGTGLYRLSKKVYVKMPTFSFNNMESQDLILGTKMLSTGEVLGVSENFSKALYKAFLANGIKIVNRGNVLISVKDKDKEEMLSLAQKFYLKGFKIFATPGTSDFLTKNSIINEKIEKEVKFDGEITNLIENNKLDYIINTPTKGEKANREGYKLRKLAQEFKIPCFTSLDTAKALFNVIENEIDISELEILNMKNKDC